MTRPVDDTGDVPEHALPAEQPGGGEQELARGRIEQTPVSLINRVGVAIGALALFALALAVLAYVLA